MLKGCRKEEKKYTSRMHHIDVMQLGAVFFITLYYYSGINKFRTYIKNKKTIII